MVGHVTVTKSGDHPNVHRPDAGMNKAGAVRQWAFIRRKKEGSVDLAYHRDKLENMRSGRSLARKTTKHVIHLQEIAIRGKATQIESKFVISWGRGGGSRGKRR